MKEARGRPLGPAPCFAASAGMALCVQHSRGLMAEYPLKLEFISTDLNILTGCIIMYTH